MDKDDIVVVGAARTPIGKYKGMYRFMPAHQLGAYAIKGAIDNAGLPVDQIDCVLMGTALPAGLGQHPARQAALAAGLPDSVRVEHVYKVCSTGTSQILHACSMLSSPYENVKVVIAGGMENMTRAPLVTSPCFNTTVEDGKERVEKVFEKRGYDAMLQDGLWDAFEFERHMGVLAERIAKELGITREDADRYAYLSHKRAWMASNSKMFFKDNVVPIPLMSMPLALTQQDETLRHTTPEKLATLTPVFAKDGVITAGNASQIADGAAAVVLMKRQTAEALGVKPLAHIVAFADKSGEPAKYLTAPIDAFVSLAQKTLGRYDKQWAPHHFDLIELNEAFAVGNVAFMKAFKLDWKFVEERMNVRGGSIALGHPLGSTGTRLLISLMTSLRERGLRFGAWGQCNGAGEAVMGSVAIE